VLGPVSVADEIECMRERSGFNVSVFAQHVSGTVLLAEARHQHAANVTRRGRATPCLTPGGKQPQHDGARAGSRTLNLGIKRLLPRVSESASECQADAKPPRFIDAPVPGRTPRSSNSRSMLAMKSALCSRVATPATKCSITGGSAFIAANASRSSGRQRRISKRSVRSSGSRLRGPESVPLALNTVESKPQHGANLRAPGESEMCLVVLVWWCSEQRCSRRVSNPEAWD
jgi:hypothetical protein